MDYVGLWSRAGATSDVRLVGEWFAAVPKSDWPTDEESLVTVLSNWKEPYGDRRQEIVLTGYADTMDEDFLRECFDSCLLTAEEMAKGEKAWLDFDDPFPVWMTQAPPIAAEID